MTETVLILGANLGDRLKNLSDALSLLGVRAGTIVRLSSVYESEPWGFETDNWFFNQAVVMETELQPLDLLSKIYEIEALLGRKRESEGYTSRTIDIDILFYGNEIFNCPELTIPHKKIHERMFVLRPICEIIPGFIHPTLGKSIRSLLDECRDKSQVRVFNK
ncbi:MAG: 2-amino-4-hydroxy-6-hydroxymethyldihydropteridine diphosphokinase [Bacteroidia bacterium]|nr:2-amino-4-hydroxy-6-hydroxymethyldihydropteridine diphosphokinase [Bacteroidia bacterium]